MADRIDQNITYYDKTGPDKRDYDKIDLENIEKALKRYVAPKIDSYIVDIIAIVFFLSFFINIPDYRVCSLIISLPFAFYILYSFTKQRNHMESVLNRETTSNRKEQMLVDFWKSLPFLNYNLRVGQDYLFGKNTGAIVRYEEIINLNSTENFSFNLFNGKRFDVKIKDGGNIKLCDGIKKKEKKDLLTLFIVMTIKNLEIKIMDKSPLDVFKEQGITEEHLKSAELHVCSFCHYLYMSFPDDVDKITFDNLPEDWKCPDCGKGKDVYRNMRGRWCD